MASFYLQLIVRIVFGGFAISLGLGLGLLNLSGLTEVKISPLSQLALSGLFIFLGFLAFGLSLRWLLFGLGILRGVVDIKKQYEKARGRLDIENVTGLIVQTIAFYREKRTTIARLTRTRFTSSKIAGICFVIIGVLQSLSTLAYTGQGIEGALPSLASALMSFVVGIVGICIPIYFDRYFSCWELRLKESARAEKELAQLMEGR